MGASHTHVVPTRFYDLLRVPGCLLWDSATKLIQMIMDRCHTYARAINIHARPASTTFQLYVVCKSVRHAPFKLTVFIGNRHKSRIWRTLMRQLYDASDIPQDISFSLQQGEQWELQERLQCCGKGRFQQSTLCICGTYWGRGHRARERHRCVYLHIHVSPLLIIYVEQCILCSSRTL